MGVKINDESVVIAVFVRLPFSFVVFTVRLAMSHLIFGAAYLDRVVWICV